LVPVASCGVLEVYAETKTTQSNRLGVSVEQQGRFGHETELTMTDRELVAYRSLIGIIILSSVVAAMTTYLASRDDAAWESLTAIVDGVPVIPARYWAQGSDFPDLTAIYFFWAWPVFPASVAAFATRLWTPNITVGAWRTANFELKYGFGSLLILTIGLSMLWSMDGEEVLGVPIGTRLADLLVLGWLPFAIGGCVTGLGVLVVSRRSGQNQRVADLL
jgi:hypothetical protein